MESREQSSSDESDSTSVDESSASAHPSIRINAKGASAGRDFKISARALTHNHYRGGQHTHIHHHGPASQKAFNIVAIESRLKIALMECYREHAYLERLFDERKVHISDSFIQLTLIKETERKQKENRLKNTEDIQDERPASFFEELYTVKEPVALTELFEPKDDTKGRVPRKLLILGRAGIGKTILCQYLATQSAGIIRDPVIASAHLVSIVSSTSATVVSLPITSSLPPSSDSTSTSSAHSHQAVLETKESAASEKSILQEEDHSENNPFRLHRYLNSKFNAVFWLKLREVANNLTTADSIFDVLTQHCLKGVGKPTTEELEAYLREPARASQVLFILDGLDEIADQINDPAYQHLTRLLNIINDYPNLLITSRPMEIASLGSSKIIFDRQLENMGFDTEHIETYTHHFMANVQSQEMTATTVISQTRKAQLDHSMATSSLIMSASSEVIHPIADDLITFMKARPSIWGIAHIPINLELLCWLWFQGELAFRPDQKVSLSKLYQIIVERVSEKYKEKYRLSPPLVSDQLDTIDHNEKKAQDIVNIFLEYLAYSAMKEKPILISKEITQSALDHVLQENKCQLNELNRKKLLEAATNKLGFLRSTQQGGKSILDQTHYFIHHSFQEFFAARYADNRLIDKADTLKYNQILRDITEKKYTPRYQLMWELTAGLLYQHGLQNQRQFSALLSFWRAILSEPRDLIGEHHIALIMHCLDECEGDGSLPLHEALIRQQLTWLFYTCNTINVKKDIVNFHWRRCLLLQSSSMIQNALIDEMTDRENKYAAFYILGNFQIPDKHIIDLLLSMATMGDMRYAATVALGNLQSSDERVLNILIRIASDSSQDKYARCAAIEALGNIQDPKDDVIDVLLKIAAVQDGDREEGCAAIRALSKLRSPAEHVINVMLDVATRNPDREIKYAIITALGNTQSPDNRVVSFLLSAVNQRERQDLYISQAAVKSLDKLRLSDKHAINDLLTIAAASSQDKDVRCVAIKVLGNIQALDKKDVTNALLEIAATQKQDWRMNYTIIEALTRLQHSDKQVLDSLLGIATASDQDKEVQCVAIKVLGNIEAHGENVISILLTIITSQDQDVYVRKAAIYALRKRHSNKRVIDALLRVDAAQPQDEEIHQAIIWVLMRLQFPDERVVNVLLTAAVQKKDSNINRYIILDALDKLQLSDKCVIDFLLEIVAASDRDKEVRCVGIEVLGKLQAPDKSVFDTLLGIASGSDQDKTVRCAGIEVLSKFQASDERVFDALLAIVSASNQDQEVRCTAIKVLSNLQVSDKHILNVFLPIITAQHEDRHVRCAAVRALKNPQASNKDSINVLVKIATDRDQDWILRCDAIKALGKLRSSDERVINVLLDEAKEWWGITEHAAIEALGESQSSDKRVIDILFAATERDNTKGSAIEALSKLQCSDKRFIDLLLVLTAENQDQYIRRIAIQSLSSLQSSDKRIVNALLMIANEEQDKEVKCLAIDGLGNLQFLDERVINALFAIAAGGDQEKEAKKAAIYALDEHHSNNHVIDALLAVAIHNQDEDIKESAIYYALHKIQSPDERMFNTLLTAAAQKQDEGIRQAAIKALSNIQALDERVINLLLITAAKSQDEEMKYAATAALDKSHSDKRVINALLVAITQNQDRAIQSAAITALGKSYSDHRIIDVLAVAAMDQDGDISYPAIQALYNLIQTHDSVCSQLMQKAIDGNEQCLRLWFKLFTQCVYSPKMLTLTAHVNKRAISVPLTQEQYSSLKQRVIKIIQASRRPSDIYNLSGYESGKAELAILQGHNCEGGFFVVSDQIWVVHLVANKKGAHAFLVIEGLEQEQHFARRYDLVQVTLNGRSSSPVSHSDYRQARIAEQMDYLSALKESQIEYRCQSWDITPESGQQLIAFTQEDIRTGSTLLCRVTERGESDHFSKPDNHYAATTMPSIAGYFSRNRHTQNDTCLTWAREKLQQINLSAGQSWFGLHIATVPDWAIKSQKKKSCIIS